MRSIYSACKIFSFCFLVVYTFSSCKTTLNVYGTEVPKKVIINIIESTTPGKLILKDSKGKSADTIQAWPGQIIKWEVEDKKIKSIEIKPIKEGNSNSQIFSEEPHKKIWVKTWRGKIKDEKAIKEIGVVSDGQYHNYDYDIEWTDKKGDKHIYDPRIQVK